MDENDKDMRFDRRRALQTIAASTAGALAAPLYARAKSASGVAGTQMPNDASYDVVIIGGGMAGVTAARELGCRGKKCLILEARNRLGGRTFSTNVFGEKGEVGGQWIHWIQPHVWAETTRYGLGIVESPGGNPSSVGVVANGVLKRYTPEESLPMLTVGMAKTFPEAATLFPRPYDPYFNRDFLKLDNLSVADRLRQVKMTSVERSMCEAYFTTAVSGRLDQSGLLDQMHWFARADEDGALLLRACSEFKIREGTITLINHMLAEGKPTVRLNTAVVSVEQSDGKVHVKCEDGTAVSAPACVVALPMNCWNDIEWRPGLLPGKTAASTERHAGSGFELHIKVEGKQPGYLAMAPSGEPINLLYTDAIREHDTIMVGMGNSASDFDINDDAKIAKALKSLMPNAKLLESYAYDWNADTFSKGTWCNYKPGMWSKYGDAMREQEQRLIFAGSDIANGWRGFIDGAIETGIRAARDVDNLFARG